MIEYSGDLPDLVDPVLVCAFEGWNDAGEAASNAVKHLSEVFGADQPAGGSDARVFAALDGEDYYDYQVHRPTLAFIDERRQVIWPTTRFSVVRVPSRLFGAGLDGEAGELGELSELSGLEDLGELGASGDLSPLAALGELGEAEAADEDGHDELRDLILVHGVEPNMRWRHFCEEILGLVQDLGVTQIVTLGAFLADVPHTRPTPVNGTSADEAYQALFDVEPPTYEGPVGITGVLQEACRHAGIPLMSFWAAVPHYVAHPPCPKATLGLLRRLEDVLDLSIPTGSLVEEARVWEVGVDELAAEDSEVGEYVRSLEEQKDKADTADLPEASGEAIAREFERYLRRRERRPGSEETS